MPSHPQASVGTEGTILLVEDYDALVVAFGSTLRRLAPSHETIVVRSLAEAEIAAATSSPDLFVIDFDPPHSGAVGFFNRMKAAHRDARVLIIAAETWPELTARRTRPGAFQFITKPFELAQFSDAVTGLLAAAHRTSETAAASGALRELDLIDLLALYGGATVTTTLRVTAAGGGTGEIRFAGGQMTHAAVMGKVGLPALEEMLRWPSARFVENETRDDTARTIWGPWTAVLSEALDAAQTRTASSEREQVTPASPELPQKKVVVIDDTELLLIFVEEILASSARGPLEIVTARTGLDGVKRVVEVKPDLVLLDYSLPDITGDEVCRRLLEDPRTAGIPVIMMSGHVLEMAQTAQRFSNVVATIEKPFLSAAMVDLVEETLTVVPAMNLPPPRPTRASGRSAKRVKQMPVVQKTTKSRTENPNAAPPNPAPTAASSESRAEEPIAETSESSQTAVAPPNEESVDLSSCEPEPVFQADEPPQAAPENEPELAAPSAISSREQPAAPAPSPIPRETSLEDFPLRDQSDQDQASSSADNPAALAEIPDARNNSVILALPLEVTSIQFSSLLQAKAIRARPYAATASMHILPLGKSPSGVVARTYELDQVELDARGRISTVRLTPSSQSMSRPDTGSSLTVADLTAFPGDADGTMRITPTADEPMRIQLLALFELVSVDLTPTLSVEHLILRTRDAKVRLNLRPGAASTGITFQTAQVLLDREARIAEVLLDAAD